MRRAGIPILLCLTLSIASPCQAADTNSGLVGLWRFDDPSNLTKAEVGQPLILVGNHLPIQGLDEQDLAVRIGVGSHYRCSHGIAPNGGGQFVNQWSLVIDFRYPQSSAGKWMCFFQTNPTNNNDGDCFIRSGSGSLGVSATGYSALATVPETWYRMIVSVQNGQFYRIYINGDRWLEGTVQPLDGRFALESQLLLFADEDGEDNPLDISFAALYNRPLTAEDAAALKGPGGAGVTPGDAVLLTNPYLQNVQPDGITIMWEMSAETSCQLEYGPDTHYGALADIVACDSGASTVIYKSSIIGLQPDSVYAYRILWDGKQPSVGTFKTAPLRHRTFSFGVWGDSQGTNLGLFPTDPFEPTKAMMAHMAAQVDLAVTVGDLAEDGSLYGDTRAYYLDRVAKYLGQTVPWFVAWGNHDQGSAAILRKFNDLPSQQRGGNFHAGFGSYSFEYAGCHFLCIDDADRFDMVWVESDLRRAWAGGARFIFVFVHRPPFCERWIDGDAFYRANLVPLMEKYGVDACFSGHTHAYERGFLNGVYYCVTGGGSWLDIPEPLVYDWPHMTVGGFQNEPPGTNGGLVNEYVRVRIDEFGFTATMVAFHPDGSILSEASDSFGKSDPLSDINRDGRVDLNDLSVLSSSWMLD